MHIFRAKIPEEKIEIINDEFAQCREEKAVNSKAIMQQAAARGIVGGAVLKEISKKATEWRVECEKERTAKLIRLYIGYDPDSLGKLRTRIEATADSIADAVDMEIQQSAAGMGLARDLPLRAERAAIKQELLVFFEREVRRLRVEDADTRRKIRKASVWKLLKWLLSWLIPMIVGYLLGKYL